MFLVFGCGFLGVFVGAILGPLVIVSTNYGLVTRRRCRSAGLVPPRGHIDAAIQAVAALLGAFLSFAALYHSTEIATLPAELGGPDPNPDPEARARWAMILAVGLAMASLALFVRAFRARPRRPPPEPLEP
jgi:hypothetical protein